MPTPVRTPEKKLSTLETEEMTAPSESPASALIDKIPIKLVLSLASPYLAGETPEKAIKMAHEIYAQNGYSSTLDILGEDMDSDATCDVSVNQYKELIDEIDRNPLPVNEHRRRMTVSLKPSMFSTQAPEAGNEAILEKAKARIEEVASYAKEKNINVTLEAEDHRWTDFHLETYYSMIEAGYTNFGTVLQSRLFRTKEDIKNFDERMRVRMVIGIYNESPSIAHTDKAKMKELLVEYARELLARGVYVEIASHDLDCLKSFFENAVIPDKVPPTRFETQYLHGVPRESLQKDLYSGDYFNSFDSSQNEFIETLKSEGILIRKYLPYGVANVAGAYCRRRLKENPNMVTYGIKNFFKLQF